MSFLGRSGEIVLTGAWDELVAVLRLCNGRRTVDEIERQLPDSLREQCAELLDIAHTHGIVCDSRTLSVRFHSDSAFPDPFGHALRQDLSGARRTGLTSCEIRALGSGSAIQLPQRGRDHDQHPTQRRRVRASDRAEPDMAFVADLLDTAWQAITPADGHFVPARRKARRSPLGLHLVLSAPVAELERGGYSYLPETHALLRRSGPISALQLEHIFDSTVAADNTLAIVFVCCNLMSASAAHANAAYRIALVAAGRAAYAAASVCAEEGFRATETTTFRGAGVAGLLGLQSPHEVALVAIAIRKRTFRLNSSRRTYDGSRVARTLQRLYVGQARPVESVRIFEPEIEGYRPPTVLAVAKYHSSGACTAQRGALFTASGAGSTVALAVTKSIAEAVERHTSGDLRVDRIASALELSEPWFDPRSLDPRPPQTTRNSSCSQFDPALPWEWVRGTRYATGQLTWVPVDVAYYALHARTLGRAPCYRATSSGVAAHVSYPTAIERAVLELIERDAVALTWYGRRAVSALPRDFLPEDIARRATEWERRGRRVSLVDLTVDGPPVVFALLYSSDRYPCLSCGAAAARDYATAVTKAFDEAELIAATWTNSPRRDPLAPENVRTPEDHGLLYAYPTHLDRADWLLNAAEAWPPPARALDIAQFDPVIVDLKRDDAVGGVAVVRAVSESLLPITFGYGSEARHHPRVKLLKSGWQESVPAFPHCFP